MAVQPPPTLAHHKHRHHAHAPAPKARLLEPPLKLRAAATDGRAAPRGAGAGRVQSEELRLAAGRAAARWRVDAGDQHRHAVGAHSGGLRVSLRACVCVCVVWCGLGGKGG